MTIRVQHFFALREGLHTGIAIGFALFASLERSHKGIMVLLLIAAVRDITVTGYRRISPFMKKIPLWSIGEWTQCDW